MTVHSSETQNNTTQCGTCDKTIRTDEDLSLTCDGYCKRKHHKDCTGITQGEFDIINRKNRKLLWLCEKCKDIIKGISTETNQPESKASEEEPKTYSTTDNTDSDNESIKEKVEYILDFLSHKLGPMIEENIQNNLNNRIATRERDTITAHNQRGTSRIEENNTLHEENQHHEDQEVDEVRETEKWNVIQSRRPRQGLRSGKEDENLQAAERKAWLYIGKLKKNTTSDTVTRYLERNGIQGETTCEELHTLGDKKAFKVGFPFHHLKEAELPEFWPQGIIVRRFRFRKSHRDEGVDLE